MADVIHRIPQLLSAEECAAFIRQASALGFTPTPNQTVKGVDLGPSVRNNFKTIWDDVAWAARLAARLAGGGSPLAGVRALNPRLRVYRYEAGQYFRRHLDTPWVDGDRRSTLSLFVYLNEAFVGGHTVFPGERVEPVVGLGVAFSHSIWHESDEVTAGTKYILKSEVA